MTAIPRHRATRFVCYHLPLILYAGVIISVSAILDLSMPGSDWPAKDKVAHLLEYAVFGLLCLRSFSRFATAESKRMSFWWTALVLLIFAALDEYVQSFTPGRDAALADYLADLTGGLIAILIARRPFGLQ